MAIPTTLIRGPVSLPDGSAPVSGYLLATLSQAGSTLNGSTSVRVLGRARVDLVNGALPVDAGGNPTWGLVPNDAITPSGTYYTVEFHLWDARKVSYARTEKWQLTSGGPIDIGAVPRLDVVPGVAVNVVSAQLGGDLSPATVIATGSPTARAERDRWADVVNVRDFGAKGDGATDDTAALNAAITAAAAVGGTVLIPAGTYPISAEVWLRSGVTVRGVGDGTVLKSTAANGKLVNVSWNVVGSTDHDINVLDLVRDGAGVGTMGIIFAGVTRGRIQGCTVKGVTAYDIWIWNAGENAATHTWGTPSSQIVVAHNRVLGAVDTGIEFDASANCVAIGNTVTVAANAIIGGLYAWNGAQDITFVGNVVVGEGAAPANTWGCQVGPHSDPAYPPTRRVSYIGNSITNVRSGCKIRGDATYKTQDVLVEGNTFAGFAANNGSGVEVSYTSGLVTVRNNRFENFYYPFRVSDVALSLPSGSVPQLVLNDNVFEGLSYSYTSTMYGVGGGSLSGNVFRSIVNHGVNLYACSNMTIRGNLFYNLGASGNVRGIVFNSYGGAECLGHIINGNKSIDDRGTKWLNAPVLLLNVTDYCVATDNSAYGAKAASNGADNSSTGTHNVVANNVNAP
jgi:hypothetical protein